MDLKAIEYTARELYKEITSENDQNINDQNIDEYDFNHEAANYTGGKYFTSFIPKSKVGPDIGISFKEKMLMRPAPWFEGTKETTYASLW